MSLLLATTAIMSCTLAPVGDFSIPEGTIPVVDIKLPLDTAESMQASRASDTEFSFPEERFAGEEPKQELLIIGRSPFGPNRYQVTRVSKKPDVSTSVFEESGSLSWLDFKFGEATWDSESQELSFNHQFDGSCKLNLPAGSPGEASQ